MTGEPAAIVAADPEVTSQIDRDPESLEIFYRAFYDDVVRYFTYRVHDPHEVADLVADTFLTAVSAAATFQPDKGRPIAWLLGIAHNVLRGWRRRRHRDHRLAQALAGRRLLDEDDITDIETRIDERARGSTVHAAMQHLSDRERDMMELVDLAGLTPAEAAVVIGIPASVARVRLHRARNRIRAALAGQEQEMP